ARDPDADDRAEHGRSARLARSRQPPARHRAGADAARVSRDRPPAEVPRPRRAGTRRGGRQPLLSLRAAPGGLMKIDRNRLEQSIEDLGRIGATPRGGLTRLALTDEDKRGRDWLVERMRDAGLRVTVDQMGNIFGERGGRPGLPPVMMGSHADSVPTGG